MHSNNDLIGQCLSNDREIFNEHVFFNGGGERRGTNGWFPALSEPGLRVRRTIMGPCIN